LINVGFCYAIKSGASVLIYKNNQLSHLLQYVFLSLYVILGYKRHMKVLVYEFSELFSVIWTQNKIAKTRPKFHKSGKRSALECKNFLEHFQKRISCWNFIGESQENFGQKRQVSAQTNKYSIRKWSNSFTRKRIFLSVVAMMN